MIRPLGDCIEIRIFKTNARSAGICQADRASNVGNLALTRSPIVLEYQATVNDAFLDDGYLSTTRE